MDAFLTKSLREYRYILQPRQIIVNAALAHSTFAAPKVNCRSLASLRIPCQALWRRLPRAAFFESRIRGR
jgi:hypothetical protein